MGDRTRVDISDVTIPVPYVVTVIVLMIGGLIWITGALAGVSEDIQQLREEIAEERVTKRDFHALDSRVRILEKDQ